MRNIEECKKIIEGKIRKKGYEIKYRKTLCGGVFWGKKVCYIPKIRSRKSLYVACHELYHCLRDRKGKVYIDEYKAERFAHRYMRHLGYSVPQAMTRRAKRYLNWKISKAVIRGLKEVNKEVKAYVG